ncbi:GATOR2 complex protein WDR59 [Anomaloglossus baeobatrachus]|uniref:GATOR2 complex protein WDR59 n=1 Tax=Anomaloglossus baeobatrachus TaxID=238106 RepID=UPI003F4F7B5E
MAAHWSSENVVVEFRDSQATAMSVDCQGQLAVLSGRRFLYIVNLETPNEGPRKISRQSKWDIGTVQWNPHDGYAHFFAASSNQRVDLYQWRDGSGDIATSLQGHTRVISDLDWSMYEPDMLVTSSIDTYIYIWDIKDTRKPTVSLSAVAGASQVKWNKKNANCLATSHDGDVRIWDRRKPGTAVEYIAAHLYKIHGLDWHPDNEYVLATSSQDNSVKFWDSRQPRKCLNVLACQVPVWKARYTPFSNGLVTVMVPQLRRENSLLLWNVYDLHSPVHIFVGHDDVVLEFQWRKQKEDRHSSCHVAGIIVVLNQESSPSSNPYALQSPVTPPLPTFARASNAYGSYQDANIPFPRTSGARFCGAGYLVYFTRPMTIHRAISPTEPTPRSLSALSAYHSGVIAPMKIRTETQGNLRLYSGSPTRSEKEQVSISSFYYKERTPPLSARRRWSIQVINDFPKSRRWKSKRESSESGSRPIKAAGKVIIQDISCLLSVHKALGELYTLNRGDLQEMCQKNAAAALSVGRRDLVQVWALAAAANNLCLTPKSDPDSETPWARHPFGRQLLESLLAHYCHLHDVQTLAMLCSVFDASLQLQSSALSSCHPFPSRSTHSRYPSFTSSGSGSSTSDPGFSNSGGWSIGCPDADHAVPWGDASPDDYRYSNLSYVDPREREREQHDKNKRILDPANAQQFDDFKKCYGEILYRWGLQEKRAEVLKFVSCPPEPHRGIEFGVYCSHCRSEVRGTQCAICKGFTFQCAICHVAVRGSSNFCLSCGHGGHTAHMLEWFSSQEVCPTGCGCHCLLESTF